MEGQLVLKIDGYSFSATLNFANGKLITFSIDYKRDDDSFTIKGADIVISIDGYHYIPEKKDLLKDFNEAIMKQHYEAIMKREISESEAKQLLLELLDYINSVTKGGAIALIEKVKSTVKGENVEVGFSLENYTSESALSEFEGINKLRRGTLTLTMLAPILIGSEFLLSDPLLLVVVGIIGFIVGAVGLINIREGFGILDDLGRDVGIGYIGTTLYLASLIIFTIAIRAIAEKVSILFSIFVVIPAGVLVIIANILVGVGFYKVGKEYNESLTKMGGILATMPIIAFIGYILVYVGLGKIKSVGSRVPSSTLNQV